MITTIFLLDFYQVWMRLFLLSFQLEKYSDSVIAFLKMGQPNTAQWNATSSHLIYSISFLLKIFNRYQNSQIHKELRGAYL